MIRYAHANGAAFFFIFIYIHMAKGLYYGSYKAPRIMLWSIGVIIFLLLIITGFLGYVLPYGQMSFWGATVITNLMSAIPWIGNDFVEFLWGGFSVGNPTLNRFFSLHYLLPFILAALVVMHLIALHEHGSSNPLGVSSNVDRIRFHPYYSFKDLVGVFVFFFIFLYFIFFDPNFFGESDNYIPANPLVTPISIVPEFYLLPFYAILRSIPHKLLGVISMGQGYVLNWSIRVYRMESSHEFNKIRCRFNSLFNCSYYNYCCSYWDYFYWLITFHLEFIFISRIKSHF
jgi:ubiquinol-cytochrome c reductase cytochrome b subunit